MNEYEKMVNGLEYKSYDKELEKMRLHSRKIVCKANGISNDKRRMKMYSKLLKTSKNFYITPPIFFDYGCNTEIGENVYFNTNCTILDCAKVTIGTNTMFGPNVQIYTAYHPIEYKKRNTLLESAKAINIGKNCWIGGGVIILPGVNIGDGCVIGAGSVVTKDIPSNVVAVGNPCKIIKTINQD